MTKSSIVFAPLVRQAYEYSCGAASLASCLYYWGVWDGREPQLYPLLGTNEEGTSGYKLMEVANGFGLKVQNRSNMSIEDLRRYCMEGNTVILSIQAWGEYDKQTDMRQIWDDGHYVVLVGIQGDTVYLMDPAVAGEYRKMPVGELLDCWHDYGDDGGYDYHAGIILRGEKPLLRVMDELISLHK